MPTALATLAAAAELSLPATLVPSPVPATLPPTPFPTARIGDNFRWIDVDLTHQRLIAYEGETAVRWVTVSTGLPRTPTVTGRFKIYVKYRAASMSGPGYYLESVPYVMYFYRGYGLHGTYWHSNFGQPMSHGCVNLPTPEAAWLFNWASVGTPVVVHY
jgi:lipoprotein-anchoring transpeptidase ErfK/SrfK